MDKVSASCVTGSCKKSCPLPVDVCWYPHGYQHSDNLTAPFDLVPHLSNGDDDYVSICGAGPSMVQRVERGTKGSAH
eukprot:scaffold31243_cov21-Prasinocladus_malaysianus.AAC.1